MTTFETTLTATQVQAAVMAIRDVMRINSYPVAGYPYRRPSTPATLLAILASTTRDTHWHWFVGYEDIDRMTGRVIVFPPWAGDGGTDAAYTEFCTRLGAALAPPATTPPATQPPAPPVEPEPPAPPIAPPASQPEPGTQIQPTKRGPRRASDDKRQIVERYLRVRDSVTQEGFGLQHHVGARQLRRWIDLYREDKL